MKKLVHAFILSSIFVAGTIPLQAELASPSDLEGFQTLESNAAKPESTKKKKIASVLGFYPGVCTYDPAIWGVLLLTKKQGESIFAAYQETRPPIEAGTAAFKNNDRDPASLELKKASTEARTHFKTVLEETLNLEQKITQEKINEGFKNLLQNYTGEENAFKSKETREKMEAIIRANTTPEEYANLEQIRMLVDTKR